MNKKEYFEKTGKKNSQKCRIQKTIFGVIKSWEFE